MYLSMPSKSGQYMSYLQYIHRLSVSIDQYFYVPKESKINLYIQDLVSYSGVIFHLLHTVIL